MISLVVGGEGDSEGVYLAVGGNPMIPRRQGLNTGYFRDRFSRGILFYCKGNCGSGTGPGHKGNRGRSHELAGDPKGIRL